MAEKTRRFIRYWQFFLLNYGGMMMMRRLVMVGILTSFVGVGGVGGVWAEENARAADEASFDAAMLAKVKADGKSAPDKAKKNAFPPFDEITKDMTSRKGLFTLWEYASSAADKDKEKLLCQIPSSMLGEKFMLSVSFSGGGFFTGFPLEERVVKWEVFGKQLVLVEPDTGFVVDKSNTVSDVVRRTYPERIRVAVPIVTKTPGGDPLIDLGQMLKSNFADIAWMSFGPFGGSRGGGVNASLSKWTKKKTFELNVEIGVELAISSGSPPGSYEKKMVHFSFWKLPATDYSPRVADDRIGYFLTTNQDWAKPTDARDIFNRYVDRWHLQKRDTSLAMCEPKQAIIFYIEKTVPVRFRRAVRDGILEWNKAFEKIGFVNAVEVRQQTDDNEWKDLDPEDMRYSFFRWIVTGAGFAMGPHRANPFTGQIYDADIIFDDSMVRFYQKSASTNLPETLMAERMNDPALREFFEEHPEWKRPSREWEGIHYGEERDEEGLRQTMRERLRRRGSFGCDYYEGMKHQMALGHSMLVGQPQEVIDRLLYDVIKEVVMHEVGHTLGLRHNFKASTIYSVEEIKRRRTTGEPTVGSVMDYNPILFFGDDTLDGHFITPTLGPYDYWAIEYGYRPADGSYKAPGASAGEEKDSKKKTKVADSNASDNSTSDQVEGISSELMAKLPADIRKMIEAKAGSDQKSEGDSKEEDAGNTKKKPAARVFKGPNASELKMLDAIASRAAEPELAYATDEDTTFISPDPRCNRFDMAGDSVEWAKERMTMIDKRMETILDWSVKDGESWYHLRSSFHSLLFEKARVLAFVGRYVGGQYTSRSHRGEVEPKDSDSAGWKIPPPFELVDAKTQRAAFSFVEENLFQDEFFTFPPELLMHLTVPRWSHVGAFVDYRMDYPIHDMIGAIQWSQLFSQLFPNTLRRIHDAEMKTNDPDRLTVAEYLQRIQKACWPNVGDVNRAKRGNWSDQSPYVSGIRRSLQREYLSMMELLVRIAPGRLFSADLHAMLQHSLRKLRSQIGKETNASGLEIDFASEAHLASCQSRIDRMLEPKLSEF